MTLDLLTDVSHKQFIDDMFEPDGVPNRDQQRTNEPAYVLLRTALNAYSAAVELCQFEERWPKLVRWRAGSTDSQFELIRAVEWHYNYVLRERARTLLNVMKARLAGKKKTVAQIDEIARSFKVKTDKYMTARGKHVHNWPLHDPFASQVSSLELLLSAGWPPDPEFKKKVTAYMKQRRRVAIATLKAEMIVGHVGLIRDVDAVVGKLLPLYRALLPKWPQ